MTAPFTDANLSEVLARVSFRYVELRWRRREATSELVGAAFILHCSRTAPGAYFGFLRSHLVSMADAVSRGKKAIVWRDETTLRSRKGYGWRRCLMPVYKANRRAYPPVSNTGVRDSERIFRSETSPLAKDFKDEQ